jgi:hypothetical protein
MIEFCDFFALFAIKDCPIQDKDTGNYRVTET